MSNDFWRGWWWSKILHDRGNKPPQPAAGGRGGGPGFLILLLGWPLLMECLLVGIVVFQFVSHEPHGQFGSMFWSFIPSMGLPEFFGWWAGLIIAIIYLSSHGFWPLGLALTIFWTPIWVLFGHQFDVQGFNGDRVIQTFFAEGWDATAPLLAGQSWKWGIFCGVVSLVGHLGLTVTSMSGARKYVSLKERAEEFLILAALTFAIVFIFWLIFTLGSAVHDPLQ